VGELGSGGNPGPRPTVEAGAGEAWAGEPPGPMLLDGELAGGTLVEGDEGCHAE
jgi:hypothetical protein